VRATRIVVILPFRKRFANVIEHDNNVSFNEPSCSLGFCGEPACHC